MRVVEGRGSGLIGLYLKSVTFLLSLGTDWP
jgi:hypothetical protein